MTYCEGLAFLSLLPSALPSFEAVESRFKLLEDGVAPLDPEGVVFKEEAMSLIQRKTRQMALVKSLLVSRKMATAVFLSLALSVNCSVHVALLKELRTAVLDNNKLLVVERVFMSHLGQIIKLITVINSLSSFMNHELNGKCVSIQSMIVVGSSS